MIVRQGINAAVHLAGGAMLGLLAVLALREAARVARARQAKPEPTEAPSS
jgi:hypothetical protein